MTDWRDLPPIEPIEQPKRIRQTVARHAAHCPRSAYLYLKHHGGAGGHQLDRGTAFHRFAERATNEIIRQGDRQIPGEVAKAIVDEILAEPDLVLTPHAADRVRLQAYHWAEATVLDPEKIVAVEERFTWEVGGLTISGTIDRAEMIPDPEYGAILNVLDYKTTFNLPEQEDYGTRRRDGTVRYTGFQGVLYCLLTLFGKNEAGIGGLGDGVNLWVPSQVFPAYLRDIDGELFLANRWGTITRPELADDQAYMEGLVAKILSYFQPVVYHPPGGEDRLPPEIEGQKWPAVPGSHCSECPSPLECPLPTELRRWAGTINTPEQAAEAAEWHDRQNALVVATWKELRAFVKAHGELRFGTDLALEYAASERVEIRDKDGLFDAVERTAEFGEPFDRDKWVKRSDSYRLKKRTLTPQDLAEEAADA